MEQVSIRRMKASDISAAHSLSTEAGWNQSAGDWQRMLLMEPEGCFVAELNGTVVGTTLCCCFGSVARLAMVIVTPSLRGRGLGHRLVQTGLEYARLCGVETIRLDATRLGEPVYRQLGFVPQFELIRMGGICSATTSRSEVWNYHIVVPEPSQLTATLLDDIVRLDQQAVRADRGKLLRLLCEEFRPWIALSEQGQPIGFLAYHPGRLAEQLGPCCGPQHVAMSLLRHALEASHGKPVIVDIPANRTAILAVASEFGLTSERTLLRMCRGPTIIEDPEFFHVSYGGEFG